MFPPPCPLLFPGPEPDAEAAATCIITPFKLEWLELWDNVLGLPKREAPRLPELLVDTDPDPDEVDAAEGVSAPVLALPLRGMGMMVVPDLVLIPLEVNRDLAELGFPVGPGKFNPPSAMACRLFALINPETGRPDLETDAEDEVAVELLVAPPSVRRRLRRLASSSSSGTILLTAKTTPSSSSSLSVNSNTSSPFPSTSTSMPESQSVVVPATFPDLVLIPTPKASDLSDLDLEPEPAIAPDKDPMVRDFLRTGFLPDCGVPGVCSGSFPCRL